MAFQTRNGRELTKEQFKIYLEGMADGIYKMDTMLWNDQFGGHSKSYDPLYVHHEEDPIKVHTYVLEVGDKHSGRHYDFESLTKLKQALLDCIESLCQQYKESRDI